MCRHYSHLLCGPGGSSYCDKSLPQLDLKVSIDSKGLPDLIEKYPHTVSSLPLSLVYQFCKKYTYFGFLWFHFLTSHLRLFYPVIDVNAWSLFVLGEIWFDNTMKNALQLTKWRLFFCNHSLRHTRCIDML